MSKKKKPVTVEIKKTRHKGLQRFTVRIEGGKVDTILAERYTRKSSAKRGALRKLDAIIAPNGEWYMPDGREIVFVSK